MTKDLTELIPKPTVRKELGLLPTNRHSNCDIATLLHMRVSTAEEKRTAGTEHNLPRSESCENAQCCHLPSSSALHQGRTLLLACFSSTMQRPSPYTSHMHITEMT